jgi:hypothetical protein
MEVTEEDIICRHAVPGVVQCLCADGEREVKS